MVVFPPARSPVCAIVPKEDSLQFSWVQFIEINLEEFGAHFLAAFAQIGELPMWQVTESSGEPSHQGWGSHISPKSRPWGEEHLSATQERKGKAFPHPQSTSNSQNFWKIVTHALLGLLAAVKPILSPLAVTEAQNLPMATSPWRLCIPHLHLRMPLMSPVATPQLLMTTMGPSRLKSISRVFPLGAPALCYVPSPKAPLQSSQFFCLLPSALPARIPPLTADCTKSGARASQCWSNHFNFPCLLQWSVKWCW